MNRLFAASVIVLIMTSACSKAPEPGDLAAFCSLLETGTGLAESPTSDDLTRLALVAPPEVRPTIEALQSRTRDFAELLALDPPDLEALFKARYDPQATRERRTLDAFAEGNCGISVDRPPSTRWNNFVQQNYAGAPWLDLVTAQFDVAGDRVDTASIVFATTPEPIGLIEETCRAVSEFLAADGADPGRVQIFIGTVVAIEEDSPNGLCRLP